MFAGCATLEPLVQDFNLISTAQEREIGAQIEQEIAKEMPVVDDDETSARVRTIGNQLAVRLPSRVFSYRFHVVDDKTPNAFTIPGGVVYVHIGLLKFAGSEGELAGVIAHELGHAYMRHPAKNMSRAYGVQYLTQLLFKDTGGNFRKLALDITAGGILSRYGRRDEYEADEIGFKLVTGAGYPRNSLSSFLKKIQRLEGSGSPIPFLSSHPPTPDRVARLESFERGELKPSV